MKRAAAIAHAKKKRGFRLRLKTLWLEIATCFYSPCGIRERLRLLSGKLTFWSRTLRTLPEGCNVNNKHHINMLGN